MQATLNLEKRLRFSLITALLTIATIIWFVLFLQGRTLKRGASEEVFSAVKLRLTRELEAIASPIEQQLTQIREWGEQGLFHNGDTLINIDFFKPILRNTSFADALIITDEDGLQLFLYRVKDSIVVSKHQYGSEQQGYDPRERPWYTLAVRPENVDSVVWTAPYVFHTKKEPGITAATSWIAPSGKRVVFAVDVLLTTISEIVSEQVTDNGGRVFIVNRNHELFGLNTPNVVAEVSGEKLLFTDWRSIENESLRSILDLDYSHEKQVKEHLYYIRSTAGNWWVDISHINRLLPQYGIMIAAPEKGLNERIEQMTFYLNLISILVIVAGAVLLFIILYHSMFALRLLNNVGELNRIFSDSRDIESFLENTVSVIARFMRVPVCSIYLFNEKRNMLVLKGTHGLNKKMVGVTELHYGEGLVGLTLKQLHSLRVTGASSSKEYRAVEGLNEESYDSFLAVPITRGLHKIGVLVVQKRLKGSFSDRAVQTLEIIASQLTSVMETAGFLLTLFDDNDTQKSEPVVVETLTSVTGKVASPGYAFGAITIDHKRDIFTILKKVEWQTIFSLKEFDLAVESTAHDLEKLQLAVEERLEDSAAMIFMAHLLMLKDESFTGAIRVHIENGINPPEAILHVSEELMRSFAMNPNKIVREKVEDVKDLTVRLLSHLSPDINKRQIHKERIIIARELYPSDILILASEGVRGIILVSGGASSHLAILCRSLQIPLLLTTESDILSISTESDVLLDANHGIAYINPGKDTISTYTPLLAKNIAPVKSSIKEVKTKDGTVISIHANVNLITDVSQAKHLHIEGIGLYRSEFPFMIRDSFPTESEQFKIYKKVADYVSHKEMTFRTLDIGGDKALSYFDGIEEENPFLGLRAIRFSLKEKALFVDQLKAILRAGVHTNLRIMFPMIQSVDEFNEAAALVRETVEELQSCGTICHPSPKIGMMVELPAAVTVIEQFAQVSDFFSIGTNDLIQYLLGVDRTNSEVAPLYKPHHPAVLQAIAKVVHVANQYEKDVSVCGDMAGSLRYLPFLLGCGVRKLSVDPVYIPRVQEFIQSIDLESAQELTDQLLGCSTIHETAQLLVKQS